MDKSIQDPSEEEKGLINKKKKLDIEAHELANEYARKREERECQTTNDSKVSKTLEDLLKIAATLGLPPSIKANAEKGIEQLMLQMLG